MMAASVTRLSAVTSLGRIIPGLPGWERGDLTTTYVEISDDDAERIIERFRAKWGSGG